MEKELFKVTIDQFEGPLDLMLHLIKENELNLFDLDVNVLTDQYILYLQSMQDLHLEIASEYLVELAELIEYKSKKLLPKDESNIEDNYEEDPQERLVRRLLEYQQYKEISQDLFQSYEHRQLLMSKPITYNEEFQSDEGMEESYKGNPYDLMKAMQRCLYRLQLTKPIETKYAAKELSIEEHKVFIRNRIASLPKIFHMRQLFEDVSDIQNVVVTFLVILDLAKQHEIFFTLDEKEDVWFSRG